MSNCFEGKPIQKMGASNLLSRFVTLIHTAGCISASAMFTDIGLLHHSYSTCKTLGRFHFFCVRLCLV